MQFIDKLRNILIMAASDGSLTEREIKFLTDRCRRWGLSQSDFAKAIEFALSESPELTIPARNSERLEMLRDLMGMMAADGDLADVEMRLFALAAAKMAISDAELNRLIDSLTKRETS